MTNRKILDYAIKGLYNEIHYKEKEIDKESILVLL